MQIKSYQLLFEKKVPATFAQAHIVQVTFCPSGIFAQVESYKQIKLTFYHVYFTLLICTKLTIITNHLVLTTVCLYPFRHSNLRTTIESQFL